MAVCAVAALALACGAEGSRATGDTVHAGAMGTRWLFPEVPEFVQLGAEKWDLTKAFVKGRIILDCPSSVRYQRCAQRVRARVCARRLQRAAPKDGPLALRVSAAPSIIHWRIVLTELLVCHILHTHHVVFVAVGNYNDHRVQSFSVFLAPTKVEVEEAAGNRRYEMCTWTPTLQAKGEIGSRCVREMNPYSNYHVLLQRTDLNQMAEKKCKLAHEYSSPAWIPTYILVGAAIFFAAPSLSQNGLFRSAAVVFIFAAVAHVFLVFFLYKTATSPGAMWKLLVLSLFPIVGTYLFGNYWPMLSRLDAQSLLLMYCIVFGVCGMIISFLYEGSLANPNVGKMLRLFLWITGIALVFVSIQSEIVFNAVLATMLAIAIVWQTDYFPYFRSSLNGAMGKTIVSLVSRGRLENGDADASPREALAVVEGPKTPILPTSPGTDPRGANLSRSPITAATGEYGNDVSAPPATTPKRSMNFSSPTMVPEMLDSNQLSPIVKGGKIVNVATNRKINIHGSTYHKLIKSGYSPDFTTGMLSPPQSPKP